jgi:hypothetical protein
VSNLWTSPGPNPGFRHKAQQRPSQCTGPPPSLLSYLHLFHTPVPGPNSGSVQLPTASTGPTTTAVISMNKSFQKKGLGEGPGFQLHPSQDHLAATRRFAFAIGSNALRFI